MSNFLIYRHYVPQTFMTLLQTVITSMSTKKKKGFKTVVKRETNHKRQCFANTYKINTQLLP